MARQNFFGVVVSQGKMQKTIKVRVQRPTFDKRINKELLSRKDYLVHDEGEVCREGDLVRIEATRPLSRRKFFAVAEIVRNKGQKHAEYMKQAKELVAKEEQQKTLEFLKKRAQLRQDVADKTTLMDDLLFLDKAAVLVELSEEEKKRLALLRDKYQIDTWPAPELVTPELAKTGLRAGRIQQAVIEEERRVEKVREKVGEIMEDAAKVSEILKSLGREGARGGIAKNLVRRWVEKQQMA